MPRRNYYGNEIPELPGWWDEISGSAEPLINAFMQRMRPDAFAGQRLQQQIQQNPMLVNQIANMDDSARQAFASTMGFRNMPGAIQNMAPGQERLDREERNRMKSSFTPQDQAEYKAGLFGLKTPDERRRATTTENQQNTRFLQDQQRFDWEKELNDINIPLTKSNADVAQLINEQKKIDFERLRKFQKEYGDIDYSVVFNALLNPTKKMTPVAAAMLQVVGNNPEAASAVRNMIELYQINKQAAMRGANAQDDYDRIALGYAKEANDNVANAMKNFNTITKNNSMSQIDITRGKQIDPQGFGANYDRALQEVIAANARAEQLHPIMRNFMKRTQNVDIGDYVKPNLGPSVTPAAGAVPNPTVPDPLAQQALDAIKQRPDAEAQIRASYKAKTGKDLP